MNQDQRAAAAFLGLLTAAMKDAAINNEVTQLKTSILAGGGVKFVRTITVPENMILTSNANILAAIDAAAERKKNTQLNVQVGDKVVRVVIIPDELDHTWPTHAPLGTAGEG